MFPPYWPLIAFPAPGKLFFPNLKLLFKPQWCYSISLVKKTLWRTGAWLHKVFDFENLRCFCKKVPSSWLNLSTGKMSDELLVKTATFTYLCPLSINAQSRSRISWRSGTRTRHDAMKAREYKIKLLLTSSLNFY